MTDKTDRENRIFQQSTFCEYKLLKKWIICEDFLNN